MHRRIAVMSEAGFTLVESMITGLISAIIVGILITIINLFYTQMNEGTLRAKMQMDYDVVLQQIGSMTRISQYVLQPGEAVDPNVPFPCSVATRAIRMRVPSGRDTVCYRISDGTNRLQDSTASGWADFKIGSGTVDCTPNSNFTLSADRKTVKLNLHIVYDSRNYHDTLRVQGDPYLCRN